MPTAIAVTSADLVLPPTDQQTPTAALLQAPEDQTMDLAISDMHVLLEQHGYVVAVYSAGLPASPTSAGCIPSDRSWRATGSLCSRWISRRSASPYS